MGKLEDGRAVFVPRTAPGDLVQLTALRTHARFARARIDQLVEAGPGRVAPRCAHYTVDDCGGCQLQHLDYPTQLEAKREIVADALARIGRIEWTVPPVVAAESPWGYRHRITLALGPGRRLAGYHALGQADRVFTLARCEIAAPPLITLWTALAPHLNLLPPDATQLVLRLDREGNLHLVVRTRGESAWAGGSRLAGRVAAAGVTAAVWWHPEGGAARVVAGDREAFPATVFEQVHPGLGDRIRTWAIDALGAVAGVAVWDLYAGIGETSEQLLARGARVESVELDRRAVQVAERRGREASGDVADTQRPGPAGIVRHAGRVEERLVTLGHPGAVIANPPRAGLHPGVVDELKRRRPARLVYLSCDPATLARDLARLCSPDPPAAFRLTALQPFDLFPQTAHVETVAVLEA